MNTEDPKIEDLYATGVVADIVRVLEMPDGTTTVILQGKKRKNGQFLSHFLHFFSKIFIKIGRAHV